MRASRVVTASLLLVTFVLIPVGSAQAAFTVTMSKGTLTITGGPASDDIEVGCDGGGKVTVNSKHVAGGLMCSAVSRIIVVAGDGGDSIDLEAVSAAAFWKLTRATVSGGFGNDVLVGSEAPNTLRGGPGGDLLILGPANDTAAGGPGNDGAYIQSSTDVTLTDVSSYSSTAGYDELSSIEVPVAYTTGPGPITVDGTSATHRVGFFGSPANDTFYGGLGDDIVLPGPGADLVAGGGGTDRVVSTTDTNQQLFDTALADGSGMVDTLSSIERATLTNGPSNGMLDASAFSGRVELEGGDGDDILIGTVRSDILLGGHGSDTCTGNGGKDTRKGCEYGS